MTRTYNDFVPAFPDRADWTLAHVLRHHARHQPDATYLIAPEEGREFTYAQCLDSAERICGTLMGSGAQTGDRVLIMSANNSQFIRTWLATGVAGLVEVGINTAYEGEFLRHQVAVAGPRWAVIEDKYAERFVAIAPDSRCIEKFWIIDTGQRAEALDLLHANGWSAAPWEELESAEPLVVARPPAHSLAAIFFTSGTTGPSKGVAMPHAQMYYFAQATACLTRLTNRDTYMTVTPLFHGNALFMASYPALIAGARLVIRSRFSASRWVDQLRECGVTVTNFVGVMMDFTYKQPPRPDDADNPLRCVFAAPTAAGILEDFKKRFGIEAFVEVFGLTETSCPIMTPYGEPRPPGAAGLAVADMFDIRLVDPETDEEVPVGQVGELVVRPKYPWTTSLGYYGMPEKTAEAWRNLWFHTGDALRRDEEGWYYFVDRYKDALRRRGENISSYEVESAILAHDAVLECAVIGVPADVEAGEDEVMAIIVPSRPVTAAEIWDFCRGRVPAFAIPRYIRFVDELPKTPSAKVRREALRTEGVTVDTYDRTREAANT